MVALYQLITGLMLASVIVAYPAKDARDGRLFFSATPAPPVQQRDRQLVYLLPSTALDNADSADSRWMWGHIKNKCRPCPDHVKPVLTSFNPYAARPWGWSMENSWNAWTRPWATWGFLPVQVLPCCPKPIPKPVVTTSTTPATTSPASTPNTSAVTEKPIDLVTIEFIADDSSTIYPTTDSQPNTTDSPPTPEVQTTLLPTTDKVQPTQLPTTETVQSTQLPTTETVQSTQLPTTETVQSTQLPTTETVQPTQLPTTETAQSSELPTTEQVQTSPLPTTVQASTLPITESVQMDDSTDYPFDIDVRMSDDFSDEPHSAPSSASANLSAETIDDSVPLIMPLLDSMTSTIANSTDSATIVQLNSANDDLTDPTAAKVPALIASLPANSANQPSKYTDSTEEDLFDGGLIPNVPLTKTSKTPDDLTRVIDLNDLLSELKPTSDDSLPPESIPMKGLRLLMNLYPPSYISFLRR